MKPLFDVIFFFFLFFKSHTANIARLSTKNPTTIPMAAAGPAFKLPPPVVFVPGGLDVVDRAVGFSVGIVGIDELVEGASADVLP